MSTARQQEERIERARAVSIEAEIARRGHREKLKRERNELVGPCPKCGGTGSVQRPCVIKQVWNCRGCKPTNIAGDVIGMVIWLDGVDFPAAVETLTGESRPPARPVDQVARCENAANDEKRQHEKGRLAVAPAPADRR